MYDAADSVQYKLQAALNIIIRKDGKDLSGYAYTKSA